MKGSSNMDTTVTPVCQLATAEPWQAPDLRLLGSMQDLTAGGSALAKESEWCNDPHSGCYPWYDARP